MARFADYDLNGWWFYFGMKIGTRDKEFIEEFTHELERLILAEALIHEGSDNVSVKNGKKSKRVSMR